MRIGGRLQAAIEIIADMQARHRPASEALKDWGSGHRFAGSGDRAAIGNLVFDALRARSSLCWRMGADTPRAMVLGAVLQDWGYTPETLNAALDGDPHAPAPLSGEELAARTGLEGAPGHVAGDVPEWLWSDFEQAFGELAVREGAALAARAGLDLRVNTLKADRARVLKALAKYGAAPTPVAPAGIRIAAPSGDGRAPNVQAEPSFRRGWFEIQDEGSQIAALLTGAEPGMQIADICAGAGGKTLALAGMMDNKGQIHAYDADRHRLKGMFERLKRAGTRNVQVLAPGDEAALVPLEGRMDTVLVDAPCTGSGVWRRRPDAKWRLSEAALASREKEQDAILRGAAKLVRPGGRIIYATCSVLPRENQQRVAAFLESHGDFAPAPLGYLLDAVQEMRAQRLKDYKVNEITGSDTSVQLTPLRDSTDGFFIAALKRGN